MELILIYGVRYGSKLIDFINNQPIIPTLYTGYSFPLPLNWGFSSICFISTEVLPFSCLKNLLYLFLFYKNFLGSFTSCHGQCLKKQGSLPLWKRKWRNKHLPPPLKFNFWQDTTLLGHSIPWKRLENAIQYNYIISDLILHVLERQGSAWTGLCRDDKEEGGLAWKSK